MDALTIHDPQRGRAALRALETVALSDGDLDPRERDLLELCRELLQLEEEPHVPIEPAELASVIEDPAERRALVQRMVILSFLDEKLDESELEIVRAFARALSVDDPSLAQMRLFARGRYGLLAFHLMRHGFLADPIRRTWKEQGFRGLARLVAAGRGKADPEVAARYAPLASFPPETLGGGLYAYWKNNGFALPGEPGGVPEVALFHDVGHVLAGYGTDPTGECEMAGLEAGYMGEDGFSVAVLALLIFQVAAPLPRVQPAKGGFDLRRFVAAWERGKAMRVDLRKMDFVEHFEKDTILLRALVGMLAS